MLFSRRPAFDFSLYISYKGMHARGGGLKMELGGGGGGEETWALPPRVKLL